MLFDSSLRAFYFEKKVGQNFADQLRDNNYYNSTAATPDTTAHSRTLW